MVLQWCRPYSRTMVLRRGSRVAAAAVMLTAAATIKVPVLGGGDIAVAVMVAVRQACWWRWWQWHAARSQRRGSSGDSRGRAWAEL